MNRERNRRQVEVIEENRQMMVHAPAGLEVEVESPRRNAFRRVKQLLGRDRRAAAASARGRGRRRRTCASWTGHKSIFRVPKLNYQLKVGPFQKLFDLEDVEVLQLAAEMLKLKPYKPFQFRRLDEP